MKKIKVIFTGGTIGCLKSDGINQLEEKQPYKLLSYYEALENREEVSFDTCCPFVMLSENLTGTKIKALCEFVRQSLTEAVDGIIITHGSDTLPYSAAALDLYLGNINLPVILVASNYPLEDERANGLENFRFAVETIVREKRTGVFVSYQNSDGVTYLHKGKRILPHRPYSDDLFSLPERKETLAEPRNEAMKYNLPETDESGILRVPCYPGASYPYQLEDVVAVLLDTYHSGTLCTDSKALQAFLKEALQRGIPVYLTGVSKDVCYASSENIPEGIIFLEEESPVAAYIRLWFLLVTPKLC